MLRKADALIAALVVRSIQAEMLCRQVVKERTLWTH